MLGGKKPTKPVPQLIIKFKNLLEQSLPEKSSWSIFHYPSMHLHKDECIYLSWKFGCKACLRYVTLEVDIGKGTLGEMFSGLA